MSLATSDRIIVSYTMCYFSLWPPGALYYLPIQNCEILYAVKTDTVISCQCLYTDRYHEITVSVVTTDRVLYLYTLLLATHFIILNCEVLQTVASSNGHGNPVVETLYRYHECSVAGVASGRVKGLYTNCYFFFWPLGALYNLHRYHTYEIS